MQPNRFRDNLVCFTRGKADKSNPLEEETNGLRQDEGIRRWQLIHSHRTHSTFPTLIDSWMRFECLRKDGALGGSRIGFFVDMEMHDGNYFRSHFEKHLVRNLHSSDVDWSINTMPSSKRPRKIAVWALRRAEAILSPPDCARDIYVFQSSSKASNSYGHSLSPAFENRMWKLNLVCVGLNKSTRRISV